MYIYHTDVKSPLGMPSIVRFQCENEKIKLLTFATWAMLQPQNGCLLHFYYDLKSIAEKSVCLRFIDSGHFP